MDGIFIASPFSLQTDFIDVERIEVLRGPQGTLFGQNSTGGAVNVNMDGDPGGGNGDKSPVQEFTQAMQLACSNGDASMNNNENTHFFQNIEGYNIAHLKWGTRYASPVTLSFWVRSNVPGIYCVGLENGATDRTCIKEYKIEPGFGWQKVELTFPGCTDGTWTTIMVVE